MTHMTFTDPLWFVVALPLLGLWWWQRHQARPALRFPTIDGLQLLSQRSHPAWLRLPLILRLAALLCIIGALARPR